MTSEYTPPASTTAHTAGASVLLDSAIHLSHLPLELIELIASHFSMKDQRTLSHCNKYCRATMRTANLIRYVLPTAYSIRYMNDLTFCHVVDSSGQGCGNLAF
jgi:hypothetical protein